MYFQDGLYGFNFLLFLFSMPQVHIYFLIVQCSAHHFYIPVEYHSFTQLLSLNDAFTHLSQSGKSDISPANCDPHLKVDHSVEHSEVGLFINNHLIVWKYCVFAKCC